MCLPWHSTCNFSLRTFFSPTPELCYFSHFHWLITHRHSQSSSISRNFSAFSLRRLFVWCHFTYYYCCCFYNICDIQWQSIGIRCYIVGIYDCVSLLSHANNIYGVGRRVEDENGDKNPHWIMLMTSLFNTWRIQYSIPKRKKNDTPSYHIHNWTLSFYIFEIIFADDGSKCCPIFSTQSLYATIGTNLFCHLHLLRLFVNRLCHV